MEKYSVIGIMSGTSLDGVDVAFCEFLFDEAWSFRLMEAETIPYTDQRKKQLVELMNSDARTLAHANSEYGNYLGELVFNFCKEKKIQPHFIASHGHTIFHDPGRGYTFQLGSGAHLSAAAQYSVICDFRSTDVALGGQGAPLVPMGDRLLFGDMDYCLNLGGIANISMENKGERIAYDICACNMVLNYFANESGFEYDKGGELGRKGKVDDRLLQTLNSLPYYSRPFPKSLGKENVEKDIMPILLSVECSNENKLTTFYHHIAIQIANSVEGKLNSSKMLVTGGGAMNDFLVELVRENCRAEIIIPDSSLINFKEAIIFAFLGVLRWRQEENVLRSVTGASGNSSSGSIYRY